MSCIDDRTDATIAEQFGVDVHEVTADKRLDQDFGADSLDALELALALEDEFGFEISDDEAERCATVQDVRNLMHAKLPGAL